MTERRQKSSILPALMGAVVGAYLVSGRRRQRTVQPERWDEQRVDAYAAYADVVKRMIYTSMRIAAGRGMELSAQPMPLEDGLHELGRLEEQRSLRWEAILLLAGPATAEAARVWHRHVWRLEQIACDTHLDADEFNRTMQGAITAREKFYNDARFELNIEGSTLTGEQPPWTPRRGEQLPSPDPYPQTG